jgi:hypothetical protein
MDDFHRRPLRQLQQQIVYDVPVDVGEAWERLPVRAVPRAIGPE